MKHYALPLALACLRRAKLRVGGTLAKKGIRSCNWQAGAVLAVALGLAPWGEAQIVAWDFNGSLGNETSSNANTLHARLNPVTITRGAGLGATPLADSFAAVGWSTTSTTLAAAQTANEYFAFTVSPIAGYAVSFSTLNATFGRTAVGAPNQFQWQYSLDGFASAGVNIGSVVVFNSIQSYGQSQGSISLSGISALQSISSASQVEFRLYAYGATGASGTVHFGYLEGNELALGGSVSAIPEPATYVCWVGLVALGCALVRRRKSVK
jgi:hypothetical protein